MRMFDIFFNDDENSNNLGFSWTFVQCREFIKMYNGTNYSYFGDYKNGTVSIVDNITGENVYNEIIY